LPSIQKTFFEVSLITKKNMKIYSRGKGIPHASHTIYTINNIWSFFHKMIDYRLVLQFQLKSSITVSVQGFVHKAEVLCFLIAFKISS
jgi:hypothetical protein